MKKALCLYSQWLLVLLAGWLPTAPSQAQRLDKRPTRYATTDTLDYQWRGYQARVAYPLPLPDGQGRIWVKGNATAHRWFRVETPQGQVVVRPTLLTAPHYTAVVPVGQAPEVRVYFAAADNSSSRGAAVTLYPESAAHLAAPARPFSVLVYGCFQPFEIRGDSGHVVGGSFGEASASLRQAFADVAVGRRLRGSHYLARARYTPPPSVAARPTTERRPNDDAPYGYAAATRFQQPLLAPPRLIIGTGDQIYLDPAYHQHSRQQRKTHPLVGWSFERKQPLPRWQDSTQFAAHVERTYAHFGSFTTLNEAFAHAPSLNVWDDHEIRDGWGSQRDEYRPATSSQLNPAGGLAAAYRAARRGFLDYQFSLGPAQEPPGANQPLYRSFSVGGKAGFAFDLRSQRNTERPRVYGSDQWRAFEAWINQLMHDDAARGQEVIIVSSMPLFKAYKRGSTKASNILLLGELSDDLRDSWSDEANRNTAQRDSIVAMLLQLRTHDIRALLLSGDIHEGAVTEVWYSCDECPNAQVLAYELVASGLSHATLDLQKLKSGLIFSSDAQRRGGQGSFFVNRPLTEAAQENLPGCEKVSCAKTWIEPCVRKNFPTLNFGALEFNPGAPTQLHLFLCQKNDSIKDFVTTANWGKTWFEDTRLQQPLAKGFRPSLPDMIYTLAGPSVSAPPRPAPAQNAQFPRYRGRPGQQVQQALPAPRPRKRPGATR